jgi:uncharacterized delta-60 repeat protein
MTLGIFTYDFGGSNDSASKILIQPDGKIVVIGTALGDFAVIRLSNLGTIDSTFGNNGNLTIDFGANDAALSGVIQTDGKIVLSGSYAWNTESSDFALARLLGNGTLDPSFGTGGKVTVDFSQYDTADSIALQNDGKLLIGGHSYFRSNDDFIAARLSADGRLDNSFANSGITNTDIGSRDFGYSIISLPDQSTLLAGASGSGVGIVKYTASGLLDTNFGQGGKVVLNDFAHSQVVRVITSSDGKIFIGADTNSGSSRDFSIIKLNANGTIDTNFATQGRASFDFDGRNDYLSDLLIASDGKILLIGTSSGDFSALRLNTNGSLDTSYGSNGKVITDIGGINDTANSAALQNDGKLVVAGTSNGNFAVIRYSSSGDLDQSFADKTPPTIALSSNKAALKDGESALINFTLNEASTDFTLSDINLSGGTLSSFNGSGTTYTALFTPTANSTANGVVSVANGVFTDAAGNSNVDGADANNKLTISIDTTIPNISLRSDKTELGSGDKANITFTLSEPSNSFSASDVITIGGTLSNFTGSGTTYSALFALAPNSTLGGAINVPSGVFTDAAGNANADGSEANNSVLFTRQPIVTTETHTLSIIVDKNVLGESATLLKGLKETITYTNGAFTKHSVEYAGLTYDYNQIDSLITTVTRDGEFTSEFTKEINDYLGTELNIPYSAAVKLIGVSTIDNVLLNIAGSDGNFVG